MNDHEPPTAAPTLTREHVHRQVGNLVAALMARSPPIDFADLKRRGVLQKVTRAPSWYLLLQPAALPRHAWQQATAAGQRLVSGRWVPMLKFSRSTNRKAAALLAKITRRRGSDDAVTH